MFDCFHTLQKKSSSDGWVELQYTALALNRVVTYDTVHTVLIFDIIIIIIKWIYIAQNRVMQKTN